MTSRILPEAKWDVLDLSDWYDSQRPGLGDTFEAHAKITFDEIAAQPRLGSLVSSAPRRREVRERLVDGFPVLVTYEVTAVEVIILSVIHGRSIRRAWRRRLP